MNENDDSEHLHMPGESEAGVLGVSLHQSLLLHGQLSSLVPGLGSHYLCCDNSDLSLTRLSARAFKAIPPFLTVTVIEENCSLLFSANYYYNNPESGA